MSARRLILALALGLALLGTAAPAAQAAFGIEALSTASRNKEGSADLQAGSHPYEYELDFKMNKDSEEIPEGKLRDVIVELPPGLIGNPQAMPRCPGADFEGGRPRCPGNSQIGIAHIEAVNFPLIHSPVYNLTPSLGVPAMIGFSLINLNSFQEASLRTGSDYGVNISDITIPTDSEVQIKGISETIWGVPADPGHDADRTCVQEGGALIEGCSTDAARKPFLSLPTSCSGPLVTTLKVDSLAEPGKFQEESVPIPGEGGIPEGLNGCAAPPFKPEIEVQPETPAAESPTGLRVNLELPQNQSPDGIATAHLKRSVITLPAGLAVNPSAADGRTACSLAQIDLHGQGPAQCPPGSKLGSVQVQTPLLDHPLPGSVYLARQGENPFGSLIALYLAVNDPLTGVVVKLAGKVEPDPETGQLRTSFDENPQLPFEDLRVELPGGSRAPLTTPSSCGTYQTTSDLTPWSAPEGKDAFPADSFTIGSGAGGAPCPGSEAQLLNSPSFEAGSASQLAGAYAPFVVKLSRENGSQRLDALNMTLPAGVTAKFAGVAECSEIQIAQAQARSHPGEGSLELASPSCPAASQIGTVSVGAGSGNPVYVQGKVYLAGPYKGAPFSLAIITPAVTGPFDLGTVVVRAGLYVDPETAQGTVKSDPIPQILQGIPLQIRSVAVQIDHSGYVLNPTSCAEKSVSGQAISPVGGVASLFDRFQVGGCAGLGYTPKLSLKMTGSTRRSGHPALRAVLTQPAGQANTRRLVLILPPTEFIDPLRTANPCTRPQFVAGTCPPASVLGKAKVFTPLLSEPLEGPIYFRANGGERELPDAVADLHGKVHIVSVGFVDAVHKKGSESSRVRTTLASVPDAPLTKAIISLRGGSKGLLVNSANLCKTPDLATVKMTAHNNKTQDFSRRIVTSCSGKAAKKQRARR